MKFGFKTKGTFKKVPFVMVYLSKQAMFADAV
jgi:hypothetical protein